MENIYDGCGLIESKILQKEFNGLENNTIYYFNDKGLLKGKKLKTNINDFRIKELNNNEK